MEALSLLKYWKTNASTTEPVKSANVSGNNTTTVTTAIVSEVEENEAELEDDGPFFDLKLPVDEQNAGELDNNDVETPESDEKELDLEAALAVTGGNGDASEQQRISSSKTQFHESVLKSATKLRVFVLGSNKTKSKSKSSESSSPKSASNCSTPRQQQQQQQQAVQAEPETKLTKSEHESKFFAVKFRAEDVPLVSLFTRDTSKSASNNNNNSSKSKSLKQNMEESDFSPLDEKNRSSKEVVHEYLKKKVKPLYIRVSRPSGGVKLGLNYYSRAKSATVKTKVEVKAEPDTKADARAKLSNVKSLASVSAPARKHSAKSRTALAAVAAAPSVVVVSSRRDDSLLQQQDGIQSAILHCKRSFNDSKLM